MRIGEINGNVIFRSGYPTFGTGHLGYKSDIYDLVYLGYRPKDGLLETDNKVKLNYLV